MKKLFVILLVLLSSSKMVAGQTGAHNEKFTDVQNSKPGLMNITELNVGFGLGDTNTDFAKRFFGLTSVLGYGITRNLHSGIGAGLSFYNGGTLVPLFLDLRYFINFGKISAYAFGDGGLLFNLAKETGSLRMFVNPGAGLRFKISKDLDANFGAGLFLQTKKDQSRDSFVNFKLGMTYLLKNKKN